MASPPLGSETPAGDSRHERYADHARQTIAITGASGLIGSELAKFFARDGHIVRPVVRRDVQDAHEITWRPSEGEIDATAFEDVDTVIHLAGENVFALRWTERKKQRIWRSRTNGTRLLAEALAGLENPPRTLVCASGIGYYGHRGDEVLDESAAPGRGFIAELAQAWEGAAEPAREAGIRVVHMRMGVVLTPQAPPLSLLLTPFKLGLGGKVSRGDQYLSWIALDDIVGVYHEAIFDESLSGPVNATAPNPVTNLELAETLAEILHRPLLFRVPASLLKATMGEIAEETILGGQRAVPAKLRARGFEFLFPRLDDFLRYALD